MEAVGGVSGLGGAGVVAASMFKWIAAGIVVISMVYLSFVLTLRDWFAGLRRGEAVTLLPQRPGRQWPVWTQAAIMVAGLAIVVPFFYFLWIPLAEIPISTANIIAVVGLALYCLGITLVLTARHTLGRYWGISTSAQARLLKDHRLIQAGPYAYVRHPIYAGAWLLFLGLTLLYPVWAMLLMFLFSMISFANRARREEAVLSERFGQEWSEYKSRTRFMIPYIW
jgi:protein-S-isoprenylcysteine O-methyltransferase Ste14